MGDRIESLGRANIGRSADAGAAAGLAARGTAVAESGEAWHIALRPKQPAQLNWTAGDIAEIWPRNSQASVEEFLARHGLDGDKSFRWRGLWTYLRDIIAHSRLPQPHEVEGIALDW